MKLLRGLLVPPFILLIASCSPGFDPNSEDEGLRGPLVKDQPQLPPEEIADDPTQGSIEQAVGYYASGKLISADNLPLSGNTFLKIFTPRSRNFGTFDLIKIIVSVSEAMKAAFPDSERLQIGDMSSQYGSTLALHKSHQNGLDADLIYFRKDRREANPEAVNGFDESFVINGKVTANFDVDRNWHFFHLLVKTGRVKRMFVDVKIKDLMCARAKELGLDPEASEMLRRLRIEPAHDDHIHIRVGCPRNSPNCQDQIEPTTASCP